MKVNVDYHLFLLADEHDAWYGSDATPARDSNTRQCAVAWSW
jgi:hypothetical protein